MPRKKNCQKHYRYVASCPDCRALNENLDEDGDKRLYSDIDPENVRPTSEKNTPEIPHTNDEDGNRGEPKRYRYERPPNPDLKKRLLIIAGIGVIVALIGILYAYPVWHAGISLKQQMYASKSDIDFWVLYTLNYWSTEFFFNKIGLLGAIIGVLIMSIPPEDSIVKLLGMRFGWGPVKKWKVLAFWWTGGFILFFIIGQSMETGGYFALTMQLIFNGDLPSGTGQFFNALKALWDPSQVSEIEFFLYQSVTQPIIGYILGVIIFRIILRIGYLAVMDKDELKIATNAAALVGVFFLIALFNRPLKAQNGIDLIRNWGIYLGIIMLFGLSLFFFISSKKTYGYHFDFMDTRFQKRAGISAGIIVLILLIPVFVSIPTTINLSNPDVWEDVEWDVRYSQQIDWTRTAAGISYGGTDYFETREIDNYIDEVISSDAAILDVIRQYDKENSWKTMSQVSINNFETMADSDIIYIPGVGEFWVAPKTLQIDVLLDNPENEHTEIFDHVEGFIALDTSTGDIVSSDDFDDIFGVSSDYPIFFGEKEDSSYASASDVEMLTFSEYYAYDNDILLNTGWNRTSNVNYVYEGDPDGTLEGLEAFWYVMNMGLTSFALDSSFEKEFLINRNIRSRVDSVLMPGITIDNDPYLVFDQENNTIYYAVSLYTEIPMGSYFYSSIYRFLGTVLVDVKTGNLTWYKNPAAFDVINQDPLKDLWGIYWDDYYYPWKTVDEDHWLRSQLRYPETLWEKQMAVDYIYHVEDSREWKSESDFFMRPPGADVFYIETDLGDGLEFVGVDLVIYNTADAKKLTGLYVIRQGDHFGETVFFRAQDVDNLIGPNTAQDQLETQVTPEIPSIIPRYGNTLLYPLAGSLYYYIPIYSQSDNSQSTSLESFIMAGLVNAFTKETYYGSTLTEAYTKLAIDLALIETPENVTSDLSLEVVGDTEIEYSSDIWAEFEAFVKYFNTNDSLPQRNVQLNMTIRADKDLDIKVFNQTLTGTEFNLTGDIPALNYTLATWDGVNGLYPGQGHSLVVKINPSQEVISGIIMYYIFDLIDLDTGEVISTGWQSFTFRNTNF